LLDSRLNLKRKKKAEADQELGLSEKRNREGDGGPSSSGNINSAEPTSNGISPKDKEKGVDRTAPGSNFVAKTGTAEPTSNGVSPRDKGKDVDRSVASNIPEAESALISELTVDEDFKLLESDLLSVGSLDEDIYDDAEPGSTSIMMRRRNEGIKNIHSEILAEDNPAPENHAADDQLTENTATDAAENANSDKTTSENGTSNNRTTDGPASDHQTIYQIRLQKPP
jgi:hypothetical protein